MLILINSFRLITSWVFGQRFEPSNVVHHQDKGEKIIQTECLNSKDASVPELVIRK